MPIYRITAPNGVTYQTEGPEGATPEQIRAVILAAHPEAGKPAAPTAAAPPAQAPGQEEPSFLSAIGTAAQRFIPNTKASLAGIIEEAPELVSKVIGNMPGTSPVVGQLFGALGNAVGRSETYKQATAKDVAELRQEAQQELQALGPRKYKPFFEEEGVGRRLGSLAETVAESAPPILAGVATGVVTRSPAAAGLVMGLGNAPATYGGIRERQKEEGIRDIDRALVGTAVSSALDILTGVGGKVLSGTAALAAREILEAGLKQAAVRVIKSGGEEGVTESLQNVVEQVAGGTDPLTKKSMLETLEAGLAGALGGTVFTGTSELATAPFRPKAGTTGSDAKVAQASPEVQNEYLRLFRLEVGRAMQDNPDLTPQQAVNLVADQADALLAAAQDNVASAAEVEGEEDNGPPGFDTGLDVGRGPEPSVPVSGRLTPTQTGTEELGAAERGGVGRPLPNVSVPDVGQGEQFGALGTATPATGFDPVTLPIYEAPNMAARKAAAKPVVMDILQSIPGVADLKIPAKVTNQAATQMAQRAARKETFNPTEIVQSVLTENGINIPTPTEMAGMPAATKITPQSYVDRYLAGEGRGNTAADLELQQYAANNPTEIEAEFAKRAAPEAAQEAPTPQTAVDEELAARDQEVSQELVTPEEQPTPTMAETATVEKIAPASIYDARNGENALSQEELLDQLDFLQELADRGKLTPERLAASDFGKTQPTNTMMLLNQAVANDPVGTVRSLRERAEATAPETQAPTPAPSTPQYTPQQIAENLDAFAMTEARDRGFDPGMFREGVVDVQRGREPLTDQQILDAQGPEALDAYKAGMQWAGERIADAQKAQAAPAKQVGKAKGPPAKVKAKGATQKANGKTIKATIKRKPGKTVAEKVLNMVQAEADTMPKEDIVEQATPYDPEYESIRAKPGINATRMAKMLGPQLYGDPTNMGQVCIKEVLQNSFDATRTAVNEGQIEQGKIEISVSSDSRTLTVKDNGVGMTPELLGGKFLEIAGTAKEGDKNAGGFGIAKMLFLYANKNIRVVTARDGRIAELNVTGEQLFESLDDPNAAPDIEIRDFEPVDDMAFPDGHGTIIQLTIPEQAGDYEIKELPRWIDQVPSLQLSPLFSNIEVTFQGRSYSNPEVLETGSNFPAQDYTQFVGVKFPWGTAKVYVTKNQTDQKYGENMHVLSNGLWQFSSKVSQDPSDMWSGPVPYRFYVDIVPSVKPDQPGYPFNFNRQGFTDDAKADFGKVKSYIDALYAYKARAGEATSFGNVQYFQPNGQLGPVIDLTPDIPVQDTAFTRVAEGDEITVGEDGSLLVNGQVMPELTPEQLKAGIPSANELTVSPDLIDPNAVMVHDNADVVIQATGERMSIPDYMRRQFGERFDNFMRFNGETFLKLRNEVARVMGYPKLLDEAVGVSFDPEYRGVSIRLPFSGSFINPLVPKYGDGLRAGYGIFGTMVHELAHHKVRSHNANFPAEMQDILLNMEADEGFRYQQFKDNFADTIADQYGDIVQLGVELFNGRNPDISVEYRGNRFTEGSGEQAPEGTGAGRTGDLRGPSGERGTGESLLGPAYERRGGAGERGESGGSTEGRKPSDEEIIAATKLTKAQVAFALRAAGLQRQKADAFQKKIARSRNATETGSAVSQLVKETRSQKNGINTLKALTKSLNSRSLDIILPGLTTDDITRWVGDQIKAIPRINKIIDDLTVYRLDRIRKLSEMTEKWTAFNAEFEEGGRALGDVMHAATFYDVDPSLASSAAEYFKRDAELQRLIAKGAKPEQITRRKNEIRRVYDGGTTDDGEVIYGWNDLAKPELGAAKAKAIYKMARDAYRETFNAHYDLLMARIDDAELEPENAEKAKDFIEKMFSEARNKVVYFPMMRHGNYWLSVGKGKGSEFFLFESATARNKFRLEQQAEMDRTGDLREMEEGDDIRQLREGIAKRDASQALKNIFETIDSGSTMDMDVLKDHIFQMYLQSLPESDMRKRFTRRQYKTGFSTDTLRNFIVSQHTAANQLARLAHASKLRNTISAGYAELKGNPDAPRMRKFLQEVELRAKAEVEPALPLEFMGIDWDKVLNAGNKLAFIWLLTGPKSALIQLTQLHITGLPVLSAEFGEAKTYGMATRYGFRLLTGQALGTTKLDKEGNVRTKWGEPSVRDSKYIRDLKEDDPALHDAMVYGWEYANNRDMFMSTYASDMTARGGVPSTEYGVKGALRRGKLGSAAWQGTKAAIDFMSGGFHHMERMNREVMYMSAFELAYKREIARGVDPAKARQKAAKLAVKLTYEAMFNFTNYNKPRIMKFRTAKLATNFLTYSSMMTSYLVRNFYGMLPFLNKEGKLAAARMFFGTMGMTYLYAGTIGMPLFSAFMALLDGLRSALGDEEEDEFLRYADETGNPVGKMKTEYWFRTKFIPETFGAGSDIAKALNLSEEQAKLLAQAVTKGPVSAITGLDIGASTSLNNLWFNTDVTSEGETGMYEYVGRTILGPTGAVLGKIPKGIALFEEGHGDRALETILPAFFAGGAKASRYAEEGVMTKDGKIIKPAEFYDFGKLFGQTLGFTNTEQGMAQQENVLASDIEKAFTDRKDSLIKRYQNAFFKAYENQSPANLKQLEKVEKDIRKFNANFPYTQIDGEVIANAIGRRTTARTQSIEGATLNPRAPAGANLVGGRQ